MAALNRKLPQSMEIKSENNGNRRRRGNRSGGRNRNRRSNHQGNQGNQGNRNRSRSRNRNRGGSRRQKQPPKPTTGQKILSILTFGLLGKPEAKSSTKAKQKPKSQSAQKKPSSKPAPAAKKARTRKRPRTEVTSGRLYVGNLDYAATEIELEELFRGVGNVVMAEVVTNSRTQQSKGFAFVEMGTIEEAKRAVEVLDDKDFMGRKLIVSGARSDGPRESADENAQEEPSVSNEETAESLSESNA